MWRLTNLFKQAVRPRLCALYGEANVDRLLERIALVAGRYNYLEAKCSTDDPCWDEHTTMLITYGDMIQKVDEPGLQTLTKFLNDYLTDFITVVHILPFFPYSSDDGFSVIDYRRVAPNLGSWDDIETMGRDFNLMFDLVINHVSSRSKWFEDYIGSIAPARNYFIEVDPQEDISAVIRPRTSPLLTEVQTVKGKKHVWTTFSADQVDLDFSNPDVMLEMLDVLLGYINNGAKIIRLDAIAYLWKELGTPCINHPSTHELVKLLRDVIDAVTPGSLLLTETNLPHEQNVSYLGKSDEAHIVYQFSLPPLLLHTIHSGNSKDLTAWAESLEPPPVGCTFLNFTASHDGIGVRPLEGILSKKEINNLAQTITDCGGFVSSRSGEDGREHPYELNITYFDALKDPFRIEDTSWQIRRFLCSQAIMLSLKGIPAVYFHSLTGSRNNTQGVLETGMKRTVNRGRWKDDELRSLLENAGNVTSEIFEQYSDLLLKRSAIKGFHPDAEQEIHHLGDTVFAFRRLGGKYDSVLCLYNISSKKVLVECEKIIPADVSTLRDYITGEEFGLDIELNPYQFLWLEEHST